MDYRKYYELVKRDFEELQREYPYSLMYLYPTVEPQPIKIRVVAVHSDIIKSSLAEEEDFLGEYSRELKITVPYDYQNAGCKVYGGSWIREELIHDEDQHFYQKREDGTRLFCVGVHDSFCQLQNVILENVKTADNMLIAYEQVHRGLIKRAKLIGYSHGDKGEREYERDTKKYRTK